jgi:hypothetical protein
MLRLRKPYTSRISNRLAGFAAILLVVTSLAGIGNQAMNNSGAENARMAATETVEPKQAAFAAGKNSSTKKSKRFKVSLFLFRNH